MHNCNHEKTETRWRNRTIGLIGNQCLYCGCKVGNWLSHSAVSNINTIGDWVEESEFKPIGNNELLLDETNKLALINTDSYKEYLLSDVWKARKAKIMQRSNGICEGCLTNKAEHVHHLTYRNIYREFAFQLVALCEPCHSRYHAAQGER